MTNRNKLTLVLIIGAFAVLYRAAAADITITVTDLQVKAVTRVVARMNAEKVTQLVAGETGTLATNALTVTFTPEAGTPRTTKLVTPLQYGKFLCNATLDSIVRQERRMIKEEVATKFDAADESTQTAVSETLGVE